MDFKFIFLAFLFLAITTNCTRRVYKAPDINEKTKEHKVIAVLPFDIIMTGRLPKGWDDEKKQEVIEQESEIFQSSLVGEILGTSNKWRGEFTVSFQSVDKTRAILSKNGITYQIFKEKDPQELAQLLGVDAVFKVKMNKKRFLSSVESFAIGQGARVLAQTTNLPFLNPGRLAKTNDVRIVGTLIDAKDGNILFNFSDACGTDWSRDPDAIVSQICRWIGKKFPYRQN